VFKLVLTSNHDFRTILNNNNHDNLLMYNKKKKKKINNIQNVYMQHNPE